MPRGTAALPPAVRRQIYALCLLGDVPLGVALRAYVLGAAGVHDPEARGRVATAARLLGIAMGEP